MLARVARLEAARAPVVSHIVRAFGSFEAFNDECEDGIAAGRLDGEFRVIASCLARWERDGTWGTWERPVRACAKGAR